MGLLSWLFNNDACSHNWSPWEQHPFAYSVRQSKICIKCGLIKDRQGNDFNECIRWEEAKKLRDKYFKETE